MVEQTPDTQPTPAAAGSTPATKSSTAPVLPPELVAEMISLTVESLIEDERDLPSQTPVTNHFLLAATLVDRTWHSIAATALLKNGLVAPAKVGLFIDQVKDRFSSHSIYRKFVHSAPSSLVLYESTERPMPRMNNEDDSERFSLFMERLQKISIISNAYTNPQYYLGEIVGMGLANATPITTWHFECTSRRFLTGIKGFLEQVQSSFGTRVIEFPTLTHLATHLVILHYMATTGPRPSLASVEVLAQPHGIDTGFSLEAIEGMILALVELPVLAKLKVPACWRTEAVEGACEAKGIDLRWT
ncbi:hypothetical protein RQP46_003644 [Phenoliferia psychrophenolica]